MPAQQGRSDPRRVRAARRRSRTAALPSTDCRASETILWSIPTTYARAACAHPSRSAAGPVLGSEPVRTQRHCDARQILTGTQSIRAGTRNARMTLAQAAGAGWPRLTQQMPQTSGVRTLIHRLADQTYFPVLSPNPVQHHAAVRLRRRRSARVAQESPATAHTAPRAGRSCGPFATTTRRDPTTEVPCRSPQRATRDRFRPEGESRAAGRWSRNQPSARTLQCTRIH